MMKARPRRKTVMKKSRHACRFILLHTSQRHVDGFENFQEGSLRFIRAAQSRRIARIHYDSVSEYRNNQPLDVIGDYEVAAFDKRQRLGCVVKCQASARAHAEVEYVGVTSCSNYADQVVNQGLVHVALTHSLLR